MYGFRRRLNSRAMQADFAAAAQRHALRRDDDGFRRVLDRQIRILKLLHRQMQLIPLLLLRGRPARASNLRRRKNSRPDSR